MRHLFFIIIMLVATQHLNAQQQPPRGGGHSYGRPPMGMNNHMKPFDFMGGGEYFVTSLLDLYLAVMNEHLDLGSTQKREFEKLYTKYYNELSDVPKAGIYVTDSTSDEDLEQQIYDSFTSADVTTEIKRSYYPKFREILSVREVLMMYDIEREVLMRISFESQRRAEANIK